MSNNGPNWYPSKHYVDPRPARPAGAPSGGSNQPGSSRTGGPIRRLLGRLTRQKPGTSKDHGGVSH